MVRRVSWFRQDAPLKPAGGLGGRTAEFAADPQRLWGLLALYDRPKQGARVVWLLLDIADTIRIGTSVIAGVGASVVYWSTVSHPSAWRAACLCVVTTCAAAFGFALNDLCDVEKDRITHSERPIPRGSLTRRAVEWVCSVAIVGSLLACSPLPLAVLGIDVGVIALLALYSLVVNNRCGVLANAIVAVCNSMVIAIGLASGSYDPAVTSCGLVVLLMTLGREIVLDTYDVAGDRHCCKTSIPLLFGERPALIIAGVLFVSAALAGVVTGAHFGSLWFKVCLTVLYPALLSVSYLIVLIARDDKGFRVFVLGTRASFVLLISALLL